MTELWSHELEIYFFFLTNASLKTIGSENLSLFWDLLFQISRFENVFSFVRKLSTIDSDIYKYDLSAVGSELWLSKLWIYFSSWVNLEQLDLIFLNDFPLFWASKNRHLFSIFSTLKQLALTYLNISSISELKRNELEI